MIKLINFLGVIIIKIFFISGLTIFSYLDIKYLKNLAFVSALVNASNMLIVLRNFCVFFNQIHLIIIKLLILRLLILEIFILKIFVLGILILEILMLEIIFFY